MTRSAAPEELRRYPDFFISEEVTCTMPSGTQAHVGVYDLTERQHVEINRRRNDLIRLLAYLSEQRLFFTVNHVFSSLTGRRDADDIEWFSGYFPAVEARNGQMLPSANQHAARVRLEALQDSGGRKRRPRAGLRGHDLHGSAGRAEQGGIFRRPARRKRTALRRVGRLLEINARHFAAVPRNDARGPLDRVLLAPLVALVPAGVAVDYFVDLGFHPPLGRGRQRSPHRRREGFARYSAGAPEADGVTAAGCFGYLEVSKDGPPKEVQS